MAKDESRPWRFDDPGSGKKKDARYSNFFQIGHNAFEFLLEFGQQDVRIHSRIYVSPQHAKMLADLLGESLQKYEATYGAMKPLRQKTGE